MGGETPGPIPEEIDSNIESHLNQGHTPAGERGFPQPLRKEDEKTKELAEQLRSVFEDPKEFKKVGQRQEVKEGGGEITAAMEEFHEKYSHWPGEEGEERQIKDYLGEGHGSRWQAKTLVRYRELHPEDPLQEGKWK